MDFLPILLFVISASIDIFAVAIAYGIKGIRISFSGNLLVALISSLGTLISMEAGFLISNILPIKATTLIGSSILLFLGFYFIIDYYKKSKSDKKVINYDQDDIPTSYILESPEIADKDKSGTVDLKESFLLGIALSLNNFGLGIGASIAGLNIPITTITTFFFSIILMPLGFHLANKISNKNFGNKASLVSGLIIILVALIEML